MPKKLKVDWEELIEAVESGMRSTDIMSKFGIKTSSQLKTLYVDALIAKGRAPGIRTTRGSKPDDSEAPTGLKVNKRGSLVVPRELIEKMGFDIGDNFSVQRSAAGVSLKKI